MILGESFSGPIAISIAASNPPGLLGLILCVTFARNPHPLLPLVCAILKPLPAWRVPRFIQQPNLFGGFNSPYLGAKLREVRSRVSQRTLKARLEAVASIDVSEKLRRVSVPVLCSPREARSCRFMRASGTGPSGKSIQMWKLPNSMRHICCFRWRHKLRQKLSVNSCATQFKFRIRRSAS